MTLALRSGCNLRGLASPDLESGRSDGQNHAHVAVRHFGYLAPVALLQNLVKVPGGVVLDVFDDATDLNVAILVVWVCNRQCHTRLSLNIPVVVAFPRMS